MYRSGSSSLSRLLAADAAWDLVVGVALFVVPWIAGSWFGADVKPWWPLFMVFGAGSLGFSALLLRAARGIDALQTCTMAAIANAVSAAALIAFVSLAPWLETAASGVLLLVALVCGGFAFLEWRHVRK